MIKFKDYLFEQIIVKDNKLNFTYNKQKSTKNSIGTKFGKGKFKPYKKSGSILNDKLVYSVYSTSGATDILKALKNKNDIFYDQEDYDYFINRTAMFIVKILRENKIQVVISPMSSSNLVQHVMDKVQEKNPNLTYFTSVFKKVKPQDIKNIYLDDDPRVTPKIQKRFEYIKSAAIKNEYFAMIKVDPKFRRFVRGFFDQIDPKVIQECTNKNVALFDDIISSGTTIAEMLRMLGGAGAKDVTGITIFKS